MPVVFSIFTGRPRAYTYCLDPTPAAWHMELHRLAVLCVRHWPLLLMDVPSHKTGTYRLSCFEITGGSVQPCLSRFGLSNNIIQGLHSPTQGILQYFFSPPWPERVQLEGFVFDSLLYTRHRYPRECSSVPSLIQLHLPLALTRLGDRRWRRCCPWWGWFLSWWARTNTVQNIGGQSSRQWAGTCCETERTKSHTGMEGMPSVVAFQSLQCWSWYHLPSPASLQ